MDNRPTGVPLVDILTNAVRGAVQLPGAIKQEGAGGIRALVQPAEFEQGNRASRFEKQTAEQVKNMRDQIDSWEDHTDLAKGTALGNGIFQLRSDLQRDGLAQEQIDRTTMELSGRLLQRGKQLEARATRGRGVGGANESALDVAAGQIEQGKGDPATIQGILSNQRGQDKTAADARFTRAKADTEEATGVSSARAYEGYLGDLGSKAERYQPPAAKDPNALTGNQLETQERLLMGAINDALKVVNTAGGELDMMGRKGMQFPNPEAKQRYVQNVVDQYNRVFPDRAKSISNQGGFFGVSPAPEIGKAPAPTPTPAAQPQAQGGMLDSLVAAGNLRQAPGVPELQGQQAPPADAGLQGPEVDRQFEVNPLPLLGEQLVQRGRQGLIEDTEVIQALLAAGVRNRAQLARMVERTIELLGEGQAQPAPLPR